MLTLYHFPTSTCSQMVRLCLAEKGLAWQSRVLDPAKGEHLGAEYLGLNPNGVVPTLVHDGRAVIDSSVIMEYLDEVFPHPALAPREPYGRASMRAWLRLLEELATPAVRYPSFQAYFVARYRGLSAKAFRRLAEARPVRKHFYLEMGRAGFGQRVLARAFEKLDLVLGRVDAALELGGGPWLLGATLSLADLCLLPTVDRLDDLGHARLWASRPALAGWYGAIRARPSYAEAFGPGARLSEVYGRGGEAGRHGTSGAAPGGRS